MNKKGRGFLNPAKDGGTAAWNWEVTPWGGTFELTDCRRKVILEFNFDRLSKARALRKVRLLQKALSAFELALDAQQPRDDK